MPRATICIAVDDAAEVEAGRRWLAEHRDRLDFISGNYGCGCCVDLYDLEAQPDVIASIPDSIAAESDWTSGIAKYGRAASAAE